MSDRDTVIETLRQMPETATFEQISEEIAIMAAVHKAEAAADAGQVTPHGQVRHRLVRWISDSGSRYPLRGTPVKLLSPTEPVADADWEAAG